jgi:non-ribosomal peptide synthetase component F/acyl carrier protein
MPLAVHLDGEVDVVALRAAVGTVLRRHPLLGTEVVDRDGVPHLVPATPTLTETDDDVAAVLGRETAAPFTGPLCRFTLVRRRGGVSLVVVAHHLVFDGTSKDVLVHDLAAAYNGEPDLGPVPFAPEDDESALPAAREFWAGHEHGDLVLPGLRHGGDDPAAGSVELDLGGLGPAAFGVTTFELVTAAWCALLHRCGNEHATVGIDVGTRTERDRHAIGPFVNELPVHIGRYGTFRELAAAVRARLREMYRFRGVPLGRAVPGLPLRPAVAPTSISYRKRGDDPVFDGLTTTVDWALPNHAIRSTVHLQVVDGPDGLLANLQYRTARLDHAAATRLADDLRTLLAAPDASLSTSDLSGPGRPVPDVTVADLFAERAAATPDAVAVVGEDGTRLTYAELDTWSGRIAAGLLPGSLVALSMPRTPAMVATVLGVWRAGCAYVPLDPSYPAARRDHMLRDSGAALLVTETGSTPVPGTTTANGLAYVIYTSGSTGRPKGVAVPHRALVNLLLAVGDVLESTPAHRWLALTSLSFDISGLELFLPLVTGGRVVLAADGRDAARVADLIAREGVTHVQATPTGWRVLLTAGWPAVTALAGGEALPLPLARELRRRVRRLLNMYGPTETTIWSTYWEVPTDPTTVHIGRPLANTTVTVRDDSGVPVPDGVVGELWIGGAGVAAGYLGQADLTEERFPDGHYRTGDLVRLDDGELEFVGRADTQVKVRGHRVELGEIEARLAEHPAVLAAAVVLRDDDLVGYVEGTADPAALRTHLAETLPDHMLPARFVPVAEWPTTPNGKLDRAALPEPPLESMSTPDGDLLTRIGAIWREVLRVDTVGPDDDLFDLGGHSLTITQIAARIRDRLGVDVPLDQFYDAPTLAETTALVAKLGGEC